MMLYFICTVPYYSCVSITSSPSLQVITGLQGVEGHKGKTCHWSTLDILNITSIVSSARVHFCSFLVNFGVLVF